MVPDLKAHWLQSRGRCTGVAGLPVVLPDTPDQYRSLFPDQYAAAYAEEVPAACPKWEEVQRASNGMRCRGTVSNAMAPNTPAAHQLLQVLQPALQALTGTAMGKHINLQFLQPRAKPAKLPALSQHQAGGVVLPPQAGGLALQLATPSKK